MAAQVATTVVTTVTLDQEAVVGLSATAVEGVVTTVLRQVHLQFLAAGMGNQLAMMTALVEQHLLR